MGIYVYPNNTETEITNLYVGIPFPESITLDKNSITLTTVGQTEQLTATLTPTPCDQSITWSSDDTTIATVSTSGLVTCVTPGNCTITATTVNGLTATCSVIHSRLPSTYQEVEWISCDSSGPYIDTGVLPKDSTLSQIKFINLATTGYVIYGMYDGEGVSYRLFNHQSNIYFDLSTERIFGGTLSANVLYEFEVGNNYIKNVGASSNLLTGTTVSSYTGNTNIMLNGNNSGNISMNKWYYVKIWEGATQVRDFVPCYRIADGVIGMYDLINGVFYTNAGSGTFTKGNDV